MGEHLEIRALRKELARAEADSARLVVDPKTAGELIQLLAGRITLMDARINVLTARLKDAEYKIGSVFEKDLRGRG
jgi:hypothetical protein